jgi:hypothetical protein
VLEKTRKVADNALGQKYQQLFCFRAAKSGRFISLIICDIHMIFDPKARTNFQKYNYAYDNASWC